MKKLSAILALLLALAQAFAGGAKPFKHTFDSVKGWDIRNGINYKIENGAVVLSGGQGLFFKRVPADPGREYELKLKGSGDGFVCIEWTQHVFENPFAKSQNASLKFKYGKTSNPRMMLRFMPQKSGKPFKIESVELIPAPDPEGWVRHDRKLLQKSAPNPPIVRGVAAGRLDKASAKIISGSNARAVLLRFSGKAELESLNRQIDAAVDAGLLPIVWLGADKNLAETWLAAKKSLGGRIEKIYALMLAPPSVPRDEFNALAKKLRPEFPETWFAFNTSAKNYPGLNPIEDIKTIYCAQFDGAEQLGAVAEFRNMTPAPFLALGAPELAEAFENANISWIVGIKPRELRAKTAQISRPMHKGATAEKQLESLEKTFLKNRKPGTLNFAFATDTHYHSSDKPIIGSRTIEHMKLMARTAKKLNLDFVANGGDMVQGAKKRGENLADMRGVIAAMSESGLPVFATIGNHDDGVFWHLRTFKKSDASEVVSGKDWHAACVAQALEKGAVGDKNFPEAGYYYMDFPESKIRVVNLHMSENPMTIGANGRFEIDSCGLLGLTQRQLDWLASQALNFSAKPDAAQWAVIFISHMTVKPAMPNGKQFFGMLKAFTTGGKFSGENKGFFPSKISCDFTKQGPIPVLMSIAGHEHIDQMRYSSLGFLCATLLNDVERQETSTAPRRAVGDPSESSWSIVTVDRKNNEAIFLRYGAGTDIRAPLTRPAK